MAVSESKVTVFYIDYTKIRYTVANGYCCIATQTVNECGICHLKRVTMHGKKKDTEDDTKMNICPTYAKDWKHTIKLKTWQKEGKQQ